MPALHPANSDEAQVYHELFDEMLTQGAIEGPNTNAITLDDKYGEPLQQLMRIGAVGRRQIVSDEDAWCLTTSGPRVDVLQMRA